MPKAKIAVDFDLDGIGSAAMLLAEERLNQDFMVLVDALEGDMTRPIVDLEGKPLTRGRIIHEICFAIASETHDDLDPDGTSFDMRAPAPKAAKKAAKAKAVK